MKVLLGFLCILMSVPAFAANTQDTEINFKISYDEKITSAQLPADIFTNIVLTSDKPFMGQTIFKLRSGDYYLGGNLCGFLGYKKSINNDYSTSTQIAQSITTAYFDNNLKAEFMDYNQVYENLACQK